MNLFQNLEFSRGDVFRHVFPEISERGEVTKPKKYDWRGNTLWLIPTINNLAIASGNNLLLFIGGIGAGCPLHLSDANNGATNPAYCNLTYDLAHDHVPFID